MTHSIYEALDSRAKSRTASQFLLMVPTYTFLVLGIASVKTDALFYAFMGASILCTVAALTVGVRMVEAWIEKRYPMGAE